MASSVFPSDWHRTDEVRLRLKHGVMLLVIRTLLLQSNCLAGAYRCEASVKARVQDVYLRLCCERAEQAAECTICTGDSAYCKVVANDVAITVRWVLEETQTQLASIEDFKLPLCVFSIGRLAT